MGANNFVILATIPAGQATGPGPVVDLFAIVPLTGFQEGFTAICQGGFVGTIALEGSLDGVNFSPVGKDAVGNPVGGFVLGKSSGLGPLELSPIIVPDTIRFVRWNLVAGQVTEDTFITLGGEQNCDCSTGGGANDSIQENLTSGEVAPPLVGGEVVRISVTNTVVRARAFPLGGGGSLLVNTQGTIGVTAADEAGGLVDVKTHGKVNIRTETGLVLVPNQTLYLSPNTPGRATNIRPRSQLSPGAPMPTTLPLGIIKAVVSGDPDPIVTADIGPLYQVFRKESFDFESFRASLTQSRVYFAGKMMDDPDISNAFSAGNSNTLFAIPFVIPVPGEIGVPRNFARLFGVPGDIRVGIYTNKPHAGYPVPANDLYPFRLLMEGLTTISAGGVFSVGSSLRVVPGLYWMAIVFAAGTANNVDGLSVASEMWPFMGWPASLLPSPVPGGVAWRVAFPFAPLPDPFPAGATLIGSSGDVFSEVPSMYFDFSEEAR